MTVMPNAGDFEKIVKASAEDLSKIVKDARDAFSKDAEALKTKQADLETEAKKFGGEFSDTKAKVLEIAKTLSDYQQTLQKATAAIDDLTVKLAKPRGGNGGDEMVVKGRYGRKVEELTHKQHVESMLRVKHFYDDNGASGEFKTEITDEHVQAYQKAREVFWSKVMRTPARVPMVEHGMTNDELKAIEALQIKSTGISTISHGSRYWLTNEMYGEIIACYDMVTDLSRMFSQVTISRGAIEIMKDNDVEKRALFKHELDCAPGRNDTPTAPGTVIIPTFELYDKETITHTMLEDSEINLESWLVPRVAEGFSRGRNEKFMWGTGANEPMGLMRPGNHINMPCNPIDGSAAGEFTWKHLRIMPFQVAKKFQAAGSYMFSRDALMSLFTMSDGEGRPMIDKSIAIGPDGVMRLWGYPLVQIDQLANYLSTGSTPTPVVDAKPIGFGAWHNAYMVVDRKGFFTVRDPAYSPCGVTWHFGQRTGGGVLCENASVFLRIV